MFNTCPLANCGSCLVWYPCFHGYRLKSLDLVTMKKLDSKVNIIPIIAKADTITKSELQKFKIKVRLSLLKPGQPKLSPIITHTGRYHDDQCQAHRQTSRHLHTLQQDMRNSPNQFILRGN